MVNKEKIFHVLKKYFGFDSLRQGQLEIITSILKKRDTFCLMPTGAGKSICYQIPALILEGMTIVISPLISLMKDQVDNLNNNGIKAAYINSTKDLNSIKEILMDASIGLYKIIYVSPERLKSSMFKEMTKEMNISHIVIDEAHCVSQWGHDFRKSYLYIKEFYEEFEKRPILSAFTATATEEVRRDSINLLGLESPYIYMGDINRENLNLAVFKEVDKAEELKDIIRKNEEKSGIIYCISRKEVDTIFYYLKDLGYSVTRYHAGLDDDEKQRNQDSFLYEDKNIIVATNAFGMGIDKSNVRYIVHITIPKNLESYYQEIGRGGRDGDICSCYLFYNKTDISRVEYIINKSSSMYRRQIELKKLQSIIDYCETKECFRKFLLSYFGNKRILNYCNNCSNCLNNQELKDFTKEAQMILSTVFRTREKFGISVLIDILKGAKGQKIIEYKLDEVTTYGLMREYSYAFIKSLIKNLLDVGYVDLKERTYSMLKLNSISMKILKGDHIVLFNKVEEDEPILDLELFDNLRKWRKERAYKEKIKPYIIFSDTTLRALSNCKPKTLEEMINIRGIGDKKIEKYGHEILNIIKKC